jgi:biofilm PGA synthesis N-glycosyltransferase PgaC
MPLSYAIVTPVRDESGNLARLAPCLAEQTRTPAAWIVVDDGSTDGTGDFVEAFARRHPWTRLISASGERLERGGPIVRSFTAGVEALDPRPDVIVKLDADISMEPDHFERLLAEFERDPRLGIAGGIGYEVQLDGLWRQRHGTGTQIWGACRAYRHACLLDVLPLEEHMGWDTLDLVKARVHGWTTEIFYELGFRHHRVEGERDGRRFRTTLIQGEAAHFMGYRFSYLAVRTLYRSLRDPASIGLLVGYLRARVRGKPQCSDASLRAYVRSQQRLRNLPIRIREALRPRAALTDRAV